MLVREGEREIKSVCGGREQKESMTCLAPRHLVRVLGSQRRHNCTAALKTQTHGCSMQSNVAGTRYSKLADQANEFWLVALSFPCEV